MDKIRFFRIDLDYIKYLWNYDNRVQYNINESNSYNKRRPYIGIVFRIGSFKYFAPLEHPRKSHLKLKSNPHILKINNGRYGLIAFNNMIPVNDSELISFNFKDEDLAYQKILINQFIFCDNNKKHISYQAQNTYNKVTV
jgi:protein AbiQ